MSSTRSIIAPPPFAANALTVIPPTPVAGVSYRDPVAGPASSPDGWPYAERVNSAEFNQIMYQSTSLMSIIDKKGVLGWSNLVDYPEASVQFGSDGVLYVWLQASGPTLGGAKDPISNPTFWRPLLSGQLANTQRLTATGTVTKTAGVRKWKVRMYGGGGQGGGTQATGASQVAAGGGGSSGSYAEAEFDVSAISTASLVIGAGGNAGAAGAAGAAGGSSTLTMGANSLTCPGGPGGLAGAATASIPNEGGSAAAFSATPTHVGALSFSPTPGGGGTSGLLFTLAAAQPGNGGPTSFGSSRAIGGSSGNAVGFGAGGTGARSLINTAANNGFFGANGLCIIEEYF